jgi:hypothetical protein
MDFELLLAVEFTSLVLLGAMSLGLILAEARGRYRDCARRRRGEIEKKARILVMEWLSPAQRAQYESEGYFEVTGCHSGRRYRIRRDRQMNIDQIDGCGARVAVWCFAPEGQLPMGDVMLAQKIALETNEREALAIANRDAGNWYPR